MNSQKSFVIYRFRKTVFSKRIHFLWWFDNFIRNCWASKSFKLFAKLSVEKILTPVSTFSTAHLTTTLTDIHNGNFVGHFNVCRDSKDDFCREISFKNSLLVGLNQFSFISDGYFWNTDLKPFLGPNSISGTFFLGFFAPIVIASSDCQKQKN